jgi:hypothetical protein
MQLCLAYGLGKALELIESLKFCKFRVQGSSTFQASFEEFSHSLILLLKLLLRLDGA